MLKDFLGFPTEHVSVISGAKLDVKFNPVTSDIAAFVRGNDLWIRQFSSKSEFPLTNAVAGTLSNPVSSNYVLLFFH